MKKLLALIAVAIYLMSCTPVILPKRGCPTNQGLIGYK
jgi:hypothetical protein